MKKFMIMMMLAVATSAFEGNEKTEAAESHHFTYTVVGDIPNVKPTFEEEHPLGAVVKAKWNTFLSNYTRVYDVEVGMSSTGTELRKPSIFKAVERANKYVKRAVKDGKMSRDKAVEVMVHILDCANVICFEDNTADIEDAARHAKTGEDVLALFANVKLKNI